MSSERNENNKYKKVKDGLLIKKVSRNNSGEYTCKAFQISEAFTDKAEATIRLVVERM